MSPSKMSTSDPLALSNQQQSKPKSRSKSLGSAEERMTGLFRVGRVVASIFDRGRRFQYDYRVEGSSKRTQDNTIQTSDILKSIENRSRQSSRTSITTLDSSSAHLSSESSTAASSRRSSGVSPAGRRERRGGMSVS